MDPPHRALSFACMALLAVVLWDGARPARAQATLPAGFSDQLVTAGLNYCPAMAFLPDHRLLVTEKYDARVRIVVNGVLLPAPVAVIDSVRQGSEAGVLGIAVDPGWPARPYVYLFYNYAGSRHIRIARYAAVGDLDGTGSGAITLDLASRHLVIADLPDDSDLHNGGGLRFGADGMLYVSLGDDLTCSSPLVQDLKGKILRLDVSGLPAGPGGPPPYASIAPSDNPFVGHAIPAARLVWAYGLRNPYSFQVDPPTGDLLIADVGSATWEEVSFQDQPGTNFGWPLYEGPMYTGITCNQLAFPGAPIYAYDRTKFLNGAAVITSSRYRRPASGIHRFPAEYEGDVFVSDVGEGFFRRVKQTGSTWALAAPVPGQPSAEDFGTGMIGVTDYAIHPDGSLWYLKYAHNFVNLTGQVRRIVYDNAAVDAPLPDPDVSGVSFAAPYPSPASLSALFAFRLARRGPARLTILDATGREIRRLADEASLEPVRHTREWDLRDESGRRVAAGVYLAVLETPGARLTRRLPVLR